MRLSITCLVIVASLALTPTVFAERCTTCSPEDPYPVGHGSVWYSDPGGVPGRPSTYRSTAEWPPMLLNGRRLGILADAYVPYLNYDVTNQAGRGFSGPQIDTPRHQQQSVGGKYAWYSAEESSLLNPSQPYYVVFPSYTLFNGNLLSTTYQAYSNQANIITAFTGPSNPTTLVLTVRDAASPNTIHLHLVDAAGVSHDYDINHCSDPMACGSIQKANVDNDFDTMRVFGTAWFRPSSANYGYDYSETALDIYLKSSNTYISYLIIHSSGSPSLPAYNDWSITTTTNSW